MEWNAFPWCLGGSHFGGSFLGNLDRHGGKAPKDPIPMPLGKVVSDILHEAHSAWATKVGTEFFLWLDIFTSQKSSIASFNLIPKMRSCVYGRV